MPRLAAPLRRNTSLSDTMELARPAPLQEVAEGPTCLAAPPPIPTPMHEMIIEDRNGLSDDEGPEELEYYPRLTMGSSVLVVDGSSPSVGPSPQRHHPIQDGHRPTPITEGLSDASTETSSEGRHSNRSALTPVFKYRHDPYSYNVLPPNFVFEESIPRRVEAPVAFKATTTYTEDDWDAPQALRATTSPAPQPTPVPPTASSRLIPIDDYPQPLNEDESPSYIDAMTLSSTGAAVHQSSQHPRVPNASAASGPRTMCCYFKQFGRCKMGEDRCWYSHEGDESTPCHYGALCKAGHAHLVKNGATHAHPHRPAQAVAQPLVPMQQPQGFRTHTEMMHAQPIKRVAPGPQYPSGALLFSDIQCTECGDFVRVQEFPAYEGDRRYTAYRAHCVNCLHTFVL